MKNFNALLVENWQNFDAVFQTKVLIVTLAETTPILEAENLQADLRRARIEPWASIINTSVAAATSKFPSCVSAAFELREINVVDTIHAQRYAVVTLLKGEPPACTHPSQV